MQPGKTSVTLLFSAPTQYLIPVFQRGYVWTLEKQVAPLWADLEDRALKLIERKEQTQHVESQSLKPLQKHFLGSLVLTPVINEFGRVTAYEVIDGQQRTTTLHLLLVAFQHATQKLPASQIPQMLTGLVRNPGPYTVEADHHKVWPTQAGRAEISFIDKAPDCQAVSVFYPAKQGRSRIDRPLMIQAYLYLHHACLAFLRGIDLSDPVAENSEQTHSDALIHAIRNSNEIPDLKSELPLMPDRAQMLFMALQELMQIMTLTLEPEDDPQVIFETLNARGEPLLASDLIRNYIFLEAARRSLSVDDLYTKHWKEFDEQRDKNEVATANRYWREKERQGRLTHPRIDLFFFHYTVLRRLQETMVGHVFQGFKEWWQSDVSDINKADVNKIDAESSDVVDIKRANIKNIDAELGIIVKTSKYFAELISPQGDDYLAEFGRLVKTLDVSTLTPVYLALREKLDKSSPQLIQAIGDLASYVTRRAVCGFTTKNYNRLFLRLLVEISKSDAPATALRAQLLKLNGRSQAWPTDQEFRDAWFDRRVYEELRPAKVCAILRALEFASRTNKQETYVVPQQTELTVEHVMPQSWEKTGYYPILDADDKKRLDRIRAVQTFGNLTLLTQPLNSSVSNGPFLDQTKEDGTLVEGKRTGFRNSLLILNAHFQNTTIQKWDDEEILARGEILFGKARQVWPLPTTPDVTN